MGDCMKENSKTKCINFRVSPKYYRWLEELIMEEEQNSASDYFTRQIFTRKVESMLKNLIEKAREKTIINYDKLSKISDLIKSPSAIEGFLPEADERDFKQRWIDAMKELIISEFGVEGGLDNFKEFELAQIAEFISSSNAVKKLIIFLSQKGKKLRESEGS
jgi:hypothetical protein